MVSSTPANQQAVEINTEQAAGKTFDATADFMASASRLAQQEAEQKRAAEEKAKEEALRKDFLKVSVIYAVHGKDLTFDDFKADTLTHKAFAQAHDDAYNTYMTDHAKEIQKDASNRRAHGDSIVKARNDAERDAAKVFYGNLMQNQAYEKADEYIERFDSLKDVPMSKLSKNREAYNLLKTSMGLPVAKNAEFGKMASMSKLTLGEFLQQPETKSKIAATLLKTPHFNAVSEAMAVKIDEKTPDFSSAAPVSYRDNLKYARGAQTSQFNVIDGWQKQSAPSHSFMEVLLKRSSTSKAAQNSSTLAEEITRNAAEAITKPAEKETQKTSFASRIWNKTKALFTPKPKKETVKVATSKPSLKDRISASLKRQKKNIRTSLAMTAMNINISNASHDDIIKNEIDYARKRKGEVEELKEALLNPQPEKTVEETPVLAAAENSEEKTAKSSSLGLQGENVQTINKQATVFRHISANRFRR